MSSKTFQVVLEWDIDDLVWVAYVPALNHLSTFGDSRAEALENAREAILGYIEAAGKEGIALTIGGKVELTEVRVAIA